MYPAGTRSAGALRTGVCCVPAAAAPAEPDLWLHPTPLQIVVIRQQDTRLKVPHCREDTDPFTVPIQAGMFAALLS